MKLVPTVIAIIGLGGAATAAAAAPVTFSYSGTITQVSVDPDGPVPGNPTFGTPFSGFYTFDAASVDAIASPTSGSYTSPAGAPFGISIQINGVDLFTNSFLNVGVVDGASSDFYTVLGCESPSCSSLVLELRLQDLNHTVFASDALPLTAPPLAAFELARLILEGFEGDSTFEIIGDVTSLTCVDGCGVTPEPPPPPTAVPEPATLVLCTTGLLATVLRRRRLSCVGHSQELS